MKKTTLIMTLVSLVILLTSCGSNTPDAVATKFATAFFKYDVETAKKYATEASMPTLVFLESIVTPEIKEAAKATTVELTSTENTSDSTAVVKFTVFNYVEPNFMKSGEDVEIVEKKEDLSIPMVKVDGKWLANVVKDSSK